MNDLVKRLRSKDRAFGWHSPEGDDRKTVWCEYTNPDGPEAAAVIEELTEALKRIAATYEVIGSETDDGEVGVKTELCEWEMHNVARAALTKAQGDT